MNLSAICAVLPGGMVSILTLEPGKGSHLNVTLGGRRTTIAMHPGDIRRGTFRAILKQLGISEKDL